MVNYYEVQEMVCLSQANILAEDLARELLDKGGNPKLLVE